MRSRTLAPPLAIRLTIIALSSTSVVHAAPAAQPGPAPAVAPARPASAEPAAPASLSPEAFRKAIIDRANDIFARMPEERRLAESRAQARMLFEYALEWCDFRTDRDAFIAAVAAMRFTESITRAEQIAKEPIDKRVVAALAANIPLCRAIGLSISRFDEPDKVFGVLARLIEAHPTLVADHDLANLVAAICLVHDVPVTRMPQNSQQLRAWSSVGRFNAETVDPVQTLEFFARNRSKLNNPISGMPVEALVYVVDTPCTPEELAWALDAYKGHNAPGSLYNTITYDTQHFKMRRPKRITETDGYTLPNIRRVGGVCVEQGFFAANVAKALGVPATTVVGEGSDTGHCYVGYLQSRSASSAWNFNEGRYPEFEATRGRITDPQTNQTVHDGAVSLSGLVMIAKTLDREFAAAMTQASNHLLSRDVSFSRALENAKPIPGIAPPPNRTPRRVDSEEALSMLRVALNACPFHAGAWHQACDWAEKGLMTRDGYKAWGDAVMKLCGNREPDFAFDILARLFDAVEDRNEAVKHWEWAASRFQTRSDLAIGARLRQAEIWMELGKPERAWSIYEWIARNCRNEGQVIVDALSAADRMMQSRGEPATATIPLYEQAIRRTPKPAKMSPEFTRGSVYVRLRNRLASLYDAAGRGKDAAALRADVARVLE